MKKLFIIIIAALACSVSANAQKIGSINPEGYLYSYRPAESVEPGMKYKELKKIYNPKEYTPIHTDRYNPNLAGLSSFFLPGLGQMICNQNGRGWAILGSYIGCGVVSALGTNGDEISTAASIAGLCGMVLNIWSIVDAVKVAKVSNMYDQDLKKKCFQAEVAMYPSVSYMNTSNGTIHTAGMSLAIRF